MKFYICLTLLLGVAIASQGDEFLELHSGNVLKNLHTLMSLDYNGLDCSSNLVQTESSLQMWAELMKEHRQLNNEISTLHLAKEKIERLKNHGNNKHEIKRAVRGVLVQLRKHTHKNQYTPIQKWRKDEIHSLQQQLNLLQVRASDSGECCDRIEKMINKYLDERKKIREQCGKNDITINIINDKEHQVEIIKHQCGLKKEEVKEEKHHEEVKEEHHEEVKKEEHHEEVKKEEHHEEVKKEEPKVEVKKEEHHEEVKEEHHEEEVIVTKEQEVVIEKEEVIVEKKVEPKLPAKTQVELPPEDDEEEQEEKIVIQEASGKAAAIGSKQ